MSLTLFLYFNSTEAHLASLLHTHLSHSHSSRVILLKCKSDAIPLLKIFQKFSMTFMLPFTVFGLNHKAFPHLMPAFLCNLIFSSGHIYFVFSRQTELLNVPWKFKSVSHTMAKVISLNKNAFSSYPTHNSTSFNFSAGITCFGKPELPSLLWISIFCTVFHTGQNIPIRDVSPITPVFPIDKVGKFAKKKEHDSFYFSSVKHRPDNSRHSINVCYMNESEGESLIYWGEQKY